MKVSRLWANVGVGLLLTGGIVCSTARAGAQESAVADAKSAAQKAPASVEAALVYGRALRRAGHDTEALAEFRRAQAYAKERTAIEADWEVARTYIAKRDFHTAMSSCRAIEKRPSGLAVSHVCAAEAHLLWRRGTEALIEVAEATKLSPGADVQTFAKLAEGRARELESKHAEADAPYREGMRLAPNRIEPQVLLGAMLVRTGKDGLGPLRRAVEIDPHDPVAQLELGRGLAAKGSDDAIPAFERAIAERPSFVEAHRALVETYVAANRLPDAKKSVAALLKLAPNDVLAHVVSGRVALAEGKADDAIKEGKAALALMPNEAKAKLLVADGYAKKGEIDLALEAYQQASGLDPLDPTPLVRATAACIAAQRVTSAKAFGKRATVDFPDHASSWVAQGDALKADGNARGAEASYDSAKKAKLK